VLGRERGDLIQPAVQERVALDEHRSGAPLGDGHECISEVAFITDVEHQDLLSRKPPRNAATRFAESSSDLALRNPITGIAGCCPRAVRGHAAAPPSSVMKSRRFS
jgi:hypothetical protein